MHNSHKAKYCMFTLSCADILVKKKNVAFADEKCVEVHFPPLKNYLVISRRIDKNQLIFG